MSGTPLTARGTRAARFSLEASATTGSTCVYVSAVMASCEWPSRLVAQDLDRAAVEAQGSRSGLGLGGRLVDVLAVLRALYRDDRHAQVEVDV